MRPFFLLEIPPCIDRVVYMSVSENLNDIHCRIAKVADQWNRNADDVHLIAVSKRQPMEKIKEAIDAGQRLFGENRVQEAYDHWSDLKPQYPDLCLHLIGPLQTNKIKEAVSLFDVIQSVDREKLASKLGAELQQQLKDMPCFIQVNIGEEEQKSGILPSEFSGFLDFCRQDCKLNIQGLMCIPPVDEPPALFFGMLKNMAQEHGLSQLSMGMSGDYEKAVPLGATYVRVGTAIFGDRN